MRILFFGTPDFAVPSLQVLIDRGEDVAAVVCQPDRPAGRGQKLTAPPVKALAEIHHLPVLQPEKLRSGESLAALRGYEPELIVVAAYGRILSSDVLRLARRGCVNVHASLLPRYRGAAPIQWAILRGETLTGVTIMQMDEGLDAGPILLQRETEIHLGETYGELQERLAHLGAAALSTALDAMSRDELVPMPQDGAAATMAPKIEKEQGRIEWTRGAAEIERQVRAFNPWPSTYTTWHGELLKVHRAGVGPVFHGPPGVAERRRSADPSAAKLLVSEARPGGPRTARDTPGSVVEVEPHLVVACGEGVLRLDEVQLSGRQRLPGAVFARGARLTVDARLG